MPVGLWFLVECNIGIVSACLPTLRALLRTTFARRFPSLRKSSRGSTRLSDMEQATPKITDFGFRRESVSKATIVPTGFTRQEATEAWCIVSSETVAGELDRDAKVEEVEMVPPGRIAVRQSVRCESFHG